MAGSLNKVQLIGNLGRDPEIRFAQDGKKIANFSIATTETWKDKITGERRDRTEWHRIVVFNEHLSGIVEQYLRKGSQVYVEGQLQTRKWTDQQGIEKYTTEVVLSQFRGEITMLGGRNENTGPLEAPGFPANSPNQASNPGGTTSFDLPAANTTAPRAAAFASSPVAVPSGAPMATEPELNDDVPF